MKALDLHVKAMKMHIGGREPLPQRGCGIVWRTILIRFEVRNRHCALLGGRTSPLLKRMGMGHAK